MGTGQPPALGGQPRLRALELGAQLVALLQQLIPFSQQGLRHRRIAAATRADRRLLVLFLVAERTWHERTWHQGAILSTKLVVDTRPSESLTSIRTRWSPGGSCASGMSMPVGCTNALTRGVRSTLGCLR